MRVKKKLKPYGRVSLDGAQAHFKAASRRSKNVRRFRIRCVGATPMLQNYFRDADLQFLTYR